MLLVIFLVQNVTYLKGRGPIFMTVCDGEA